MMSTETKRRWAHKLADLGFYIIPLAENSRRPASEAEWKQIRTRDHAQIDRWFDANPRINYGVNPGEQGVLIDIDCKKGKNGMISWYEATDGDLPDTLGVRTPNGGKHYYFRTDKPASNAHSFGEGIDVRGEGGYVVGPGCTADGREYEVVDGQDTVAEFPADLAHYLGRVTQKVTDEVMERARDLVDSESSLTRAKSFLDQARPAIEGQGGDQETYNVMCRLVRDIGVAPETAATLAVSTGWNDRCEPPWDYDDLLAKAQNASKYGENMLGQRNGGLLMELDLPDSVLPPENWKPEVSEDDMPEEEASQKKFSKIVFGDEILTAMTPRRMIVRHWLTGFGFIPVLAKRSVGKSTCMMDLALHLACDMQWHGEATMPDWNVLYMSGEDPQGTREQYEAWVRRHGRHPRGNRFGFVDEIPNLLEWNDASHLHQIYKEQWNGKPTLLVFDTWQRATSGASQNDDEMMQKAIKHIELFTKQVDGAALVAAHPPKHDLSSMSGTMVIENSTTCIWKMEVDAEVGQGLIRTLEVERIKGPGVGNYKNFALQSIPLDGRDEFGKPRSGAYFEYAPDPTLYTAQLEATDNSQGGEGGEDDIPF